MPGDDGGTHGDALSAGSYWVGGIFYVCAHDDVCGGIGGSGWCGGAEEEGSAYAEEGIRA